MFVPKLGQDPEFCVHFGGLLCEFLFVFQIFIEAFDCDYFPGQFVEANIDFAKGSSSYDSAYLVIFEVRVWRPLVPLESNLDLPFDVPYFVLSGRLLFDFIFVFRKVLEFGLNVFNLVDELLLVIDQVLYKSLVVLELPPLMRCRGLALPDVQPGVQLLARLHARIRVSRLHSFPASLFPLSLSLIFCQRAGKAFGHCGAL